MLNANSIVLTARLGFFSDYSLQCKRKQLQSTFLRKISNRLWGIFNNYKEKLNVSSVHTAALI